MITTQVHGKTYVIDGKGEFSPAEELTLEDWLHAMNAQDAAQKRHRSPETVTHTASASARRPTSATVKAFSSTASAKTTSGR